MAWANIYFQWTTNGWLVGAWAAFAAYVVTVFPLTVRDWWIYRHARRAEYAEKKAAGIPYGWRVHLPWNSRAVSAVARKDEIPLGVIRPPVSVRKEDVLLRASKRRIRR